MPDPLIHLQDGDIKTATKEQLHKDIEDYPIDSVSTFGITLMDIGNTEDLKEKVIRKVE